MVAVNDITANMPKRSRFGAIENVNANHIDWREVEGSPGNYLKVLTIDEANPRVDFLFRQDPHAEFATHTHLCTAVAYTIAGKWGYREGPELHVPGCFSYEPAGSTHTPYATAEGMTVYASFVGEDEKMLDILDDDSNHVAYITLDFFKQYYDA